MNESLLLLLIIGAWLGKSYDGCGWLGLYYVISSRHLHLTLFVNLHLLSFFFSSCAATVCAKGLLERSCIIRLNLIALCVIIAILLSSHTESLIVSRRSQVT